MWCMLVYVFPLPKIEIFVNFILTHAWGKTYTTYTNIHQPPLLNPLHLIPGHDAQVVKLTVAISVLCSSSVVQPGVT
jgi:hypothetical protein